MITSIVRLLFLIIVLNTAQAEERRVKLDFDKSKKNKETKENNQNILELNTSRIEENISKDPQFSTTSTDQKIIDEALEKNQVQSEERTLSQIQKIEECGKKGIIEEIRRCRMEFLKNK